MKHAAITSAADEDLPPILCVQIQQRPASQQATIQPKSTCKAEADHIGSTQHTFSGHYGSPRARLDT